MRTYLVSLCLGWLATAGCCHLRMSQPVAPVPPLPAALSAGFDYPNNVDLATKEERARQLSRYDVVRVEIAGSPGRFDTNRLVTLDYYAPHNEGKNPVVLVVPVSGGAYELERYFSAYFAKRGWAAVIVHRRKPSRDPVNGEELDAGLRDSVNDVRRAMDWIETRPELDAGRIGVFGVSQGGIKAVILAPLDPRVRATVVGLAGGDVPYILRHSADRGIARRRKKMLKENGFTPAELEARYRTGFMCDPNTFAPYVPREKVLLVLACCDRAVPIRKGRELRRKMGRPETIFLPTGHYTALLCIPLIQRESFKFFRKRFYGKRSADFSPQEGRLATRP